MFGEGIKYNPYNNFIASHSALTNVINLTDLTYNPSSSPQGNYPPTSTLMCNVDSTSSGPLNKSMSTTEITPFSSESEVSMSTENSSTTTMVDDYIINLESEVEV